MLFKIGYIDDISDNQYESIYANLTPSRKERIDKYKKQDDRKRSLMATYLLNQLLLQTGNDHLEINSDSSGKPYVKDEGLFISISHSEKAVACALSDRKIGIDIEKIKPVTPGLIEYVCTEKEKNFVLSDNNEIERRFFAIWTAKEAFFKKDNADIKNLCKIDAFLFEKQTFMENDYMITIVE